MALNIGVFSFKGSVVGTSLFVIFYMVIRGQNVLELNVNSVTKGPINSDV